MNPFQRILVPTDFSEPAERALDEAMALASKLGSQLILLHVSWCPPIAYNSFVEAPLWTAEELTRGAQDEFDKQLASAKQRYAKTEGVFVTGDPWTGILRTAEEVGADLIVMGTHGRRGLSHLLLGSVAEKIVRLSPIPVLTLSGGAEREARRRVLADQHPQD